MTQSFTFSEPVPDGDVMPDLPWKQTIAFNLLPNEPAALEMPGQKRRRESELTEGLMLSNDFSGNTDPPNCSNSNSSNFCDLGAAHHVVVATEKVSFLDRMQSTRSDSQCQNYNAVVDSSSASAHVARSEPSWCRSDQSPTGVSMEAATVQVMAGFGAIVSENRKSASGLMSLNSANAQAMATIHKATVSEGRRSSSSLSCQPHNTSETAQGYAFSPFVTTQGDHHHHHHHQEQQEQHHSNHHRSGSSTENHFSFGISNLNVHEVDETSWPNLTCRTSSRSLFESSTTPQSPCTPRGMQETILTDSQQAYLHYMKQINSIPASTDDYDDHPESLDHQLVHSSLEAPRRNLSFVGYQASGRSLFPFGGFECPAPRTAHIIKHARQVIHSTDYELAPEHDHDVGDGFTSHVVDGECSPVQLEFGRGVGHDALEEVMLEPAAPVAPVIMASAESGVGERFDLNEVPVGVGVDVGTTPKARKKYHPKVAKDKRPYNRRAPGKKGVPASSETPVDKFTNMASLKRKARMGSSNRSSHEDLQGRDHHASHSEVVDMDIDNIVLTKTSTTTGELLDMAVCDCGVCIKLRQEKRFTNVAQSSPDVISPTQHHRSNWQSSPPNSPPSSVRRTLFQVPPNTQEAAAAPLAAGQTVVPDTNSCNSIVTLSQDCPRAILSPQTVAFGDMNPVQLDHVGGGGGAGGVVAVVKRRPGRPQKIRSNSKAGKVKEGSEIVSAGSGIISQHHMHGLEMVPYQDKSVVPFLPLIRKKKIRAKVVLNEETVREWKLLMGGPSKSYTGDSSDAEKLELMWEDERRKMKAQALNFIERMHIVMGDRSFSKWKGSVVDSVVGAFLTQNVNDVLSSSAFMSMRSRFPRGGFRKASSGEADDTRGAQPDPSVQQHAPLLVVPSAPPPMLPAQSSGGISEASSPSPSPAQLIIRADREPCPSDVAVLDHEAQLESRDNGRYDILAGAAASTGGEEQQPQDGIMTLLQRCFRREESSKTSANSVVTEEVISQTGGVVSVVDTQPSSQVVGKYNPKTGLTGLERAKQEEKQVTARIDFDFSKLHDDFKPGAPGQAPRRAPPARTEDTEDAVDWEAVRRIDVAEVAEVIKERGVNWVLAGRIKAFLERIHLDYGAVDLEWLRSMPTDQTKDFLLSIRGLGLKSVECVRLLTLHHLAFPVDTNVGRICVRLGWVPLEPLPEEILLHELDSFPMQATIQKYLWPRLCKFDHKTLYELHYQMISFGKVFCTKTKPNCNACPMRPECKHFASALSSAKLALPPSERPSSSSSSSPTLALPAPVSENTSAEVTPTSRPVSQYCQPIIEEPMTPEYGDLDIEDFNIEDYPFLVQELSPDDTINTSTSSHIVTCSSPPINVTDTEPVSVILPELVPESGAAVIEIVESTDDLEQVLENPRVLVASSIASQEMVLVAPGVASLPVPKLKNVGRLRTIHYVYELPDNHPLLDGLDPKEGDDPCTYLLAIWGQDEVPETIPNMNDSVNEENDTFASSSCEGEETIKATLLVPCRTAMRGSFPLNGTYFQVNEVFADHASSLQPMLVPRTLLWNLRRRFVFFGTSVISIFRGMTAPEIQACFWRGYVCVRGFDRLTKAPKPLVGRLHLQAAKAKGVNAADA